MIIDIAVENDNANFKMYPKDANFPYKFNFLDRTTGIIVQVGIDHNTFNGLMEKLNNEVTK